MSTDREQLAALAARLTPEPDPAPADGDVWAEIIARTSDPRLRALYVERRAQGIARYGVPLQRSNGRSHIVDALQEAVDLVAYCTAADLPGLAGDEPPHPIEDSAKLGAIVRDLSRIEPRHGILSRTSKGRQHVIVANVDQLLCIASTVPRVADTINTC